MRFRPFFWPAPRGPVWRSVVYLGCLCMVTDLGAQTPQPPKPEKKPEPPKEAPPTEQTVDAPPSNSQATARPNPLCSPNGSSAPIIPLD